MLKGHGFGKVVASALVACACVFGLVALSGCANEEDQIRSELSKELDSVKNLDEGVIEQLVGAISSEDQEVFDSVGIDATEFVTTYFDGFDYTIDDVTVNGDTADITLTLTCRTASALETAMMEVVENIDYDELVSTGDMTMIGTAIIDAIRAVEPTQSGPVTIQAQKVDGTWNLDESADEALVSLMM